MAFVVKCCPVIKRWNCFCCSCELRTAAVCVGWTYMVFSIIAVLITSIELTKLADVEASSDTSLEFLSKELNIGYLSGSIASVLLYGVLLFGVHKKKPVYMVPSLVFQLICIIISAIFYTVYSIMSIVSLGEYGLIIVPIFVIIFAVNVFVWIVFYSYYRQLEDENATVSVHGVVNYTYQKVNEDETIQNSVNPTEFHSTANNDLQKIFSAD